MKKLALIFPGQGSQYRGMGQLLFEDPALNTVFEEASDIIGRDVKELCINGEEDLQKTEYCQPIILCISYAMYLKYIRTGNVFIAAAAGHSLGEYSALVCSGALRYSDALRLLWSRGHLMKNTINESGTQWLMYAVTGLPSSEIKKIIEEGDPAHISVAAINGPAQCVVAGEKQLASHFEELFKSAGARIVHLKVSVPFHSPMLRSASEAMMSELSKYDFSIPAFPVFNNVDGERYTSVKQIRTCLSNQVYKTVQWMGIMENMSLNKVSVLLELGPGNVLSTLCRNSQLPLHSFTIDDARSFNEYRQLISDSSHDFYSAIHWAIANGVSAANQNDDEKAQLRIVSHIRTLKNMLDDVQKQHRAPTPVEIRHARETLTDLLLLKRVPGNEMERRMKVFNSFPTSQA
jgi:[acyl-carrier-protein] S-malonyltransferase